MRSEPTSSGIAILDLEAGFHAGLQDKGLAAEVFQARAAQRVDDRRHDRTDGDVRDGFRVDAVLAQDRAQKQPEFVGRADRVRAVAELHPQDIAVEDAAVDVGVAYVETEQHGE